MGGLIAQIDQLSATKAKRGAAQDVSQDSENYGTWHRGEFYQEMTEFYKSPERNRIWTHPQVELREVDKVNVQRLSMLMDDVSGEESQLLQGKDSFVSIQDAGGLSVIKERVTAENKGSAMNLEENGLLSPATQKESEQQSAAWQRICLITNSLDHTRFGELKKLVNPPRPVMSALSCLLSWLYPDAGEMSWGDIVNFLKPGKVAVHQMQGRMLSVPKTALSKDQISILRGSAGLNNTARNASSQVDFVSDYFDAVRAFLQIDGSIPEEQTQPQSSAKKVKKTRASTASSPVKKPATIRVEHSSMAHFDDTTRGAWDAVVAAANNVSGGDLSELKALKNPPALVGQVLSTFTKLVCPELGAEVTWLDVKKHVLALPKSSIPDLKVKMIQAAGGSLNPVQRQALTELTASPEDVMKKSAAAASLSAYLVAVQAFLNIDVGRRPAASA